MIFLFWLMLGAGALLAAAIAVRIWAYVRRFRHSPRKDYAHNFLDPAAGEYSVPLNRSGFIWPGAVGQWDTAVLEIKLQSTLLGLILDPYVEHSVADKSGRQFFERGCRGLRFLILVCVLPGRVAKGDLVRLRGGFVHWLPRQGRLRLFKLETNASDPVVVIAPHPDDAELAAFGLYSRHSSATVTVTRGECGGRPYVSLPGKAAHKTVRGKVRTWESVAVPLLGGVTAARCQNLGYADGSLLELYARRGAQKSAQPDNLNAADEGSHSWDGLVADMAAKLKNIRPRLVVTPHPILDDNADHRLSTLAVLTALDRLGLTEGNLLLYVIHSGWTNHYPFGHAGAVLGPAPWFDNNAPAAAGYSLSLSNEEVMLKYLALESMSDLRPAVNGVTSDWPTLARWFLRQSFAKFAGIRVPEDAQLARALFQNEFFLVMPFSAVKGLIAAIEKRLADRSGW